MLPDLFALVIFLIGSHFMPVPAGLWEPPIYASQVAGMTGVHHHTQFFIG
jgi:hypothetical protein